jgi:hypothetical protein
MFSKITNQFSVGIENGNRVPGFFDKLVFFANRFTAFAFAFAAPQKLKEAIPNATCRMRG